MLNLPVELIENICMHLDVGSIVNFILTCKYHSVCLLDSFFKLYCHKLYGCQFWKNALKRCPKYHSNSWKQELYSIESFQKMILEIEGKKWVDTDFYNLWRVRS